MIYLGLEGGNLIGLIREDGGENRGPALIRGEPVNDSTWHHGMVIRDVVGDRISLYVDGALQGTKPAAASGAAGSITTNTRALACDRYNVIRQQSTIDREYLRGAIDQVCVYKSKPRFVGSKADSPAPPATAPLRIRQEGRAYRLALAPDGKQLITGVNNFLRRWDATTGKPIGEPIAYKSPVHGVAFSPNGELFATGCGDGRPRLYDAATSELRREFDNQQGDVARLAFSPDSKVLAAHSGHIMVLWDVKTGVRIADCKAPKSSPPIFGITDVAFSPDGKLLAASDQHLAVHVWDAKSGELRHTLPGHRREVFSVAFSPDGKWLASGSLDGTAKLWSATDFKVVATLEGKGRMGSVQFAPDSRILITAGGDAVRLWDVATRSVIATLPGEHDILGIQFSRDGTVLATGGSADFVNIWDGAALLGKPDAKAGQASPPPPDIAPFIGQWEHPAFIREVWTVKYEDAKLSVSGIYYRDSVEVGSFVSKSVEFKDGTLSFEQVYVASPSPIYKDARSTLKIDPKNPDRVLRTWKNDTGSGSDAFPRMKN